MTSKGSVIARRTAARLFAVQAVYQALQNQQAPSALFDEYMTFRVGMDLDDGGSEQNTMIPPDRELFRDILTGVTDRWGDLQQMLSPKIKNGGNVEPLLTAILLCGAYELLAHSKIDAPIIISDYLEVTAGFFDNAEPKLVNAILDSLAKELRGAA